MEKQTLRDTKEMLLQYNQEKERRRKTRKIYSFYPDEGPLRRELYKPHIAFFEAGSKYRSRAIIAANRIGKCQTYQTLIDAPDGKKSIGELYEAGRPFQVISWDGKKKVIGQAQAPVRLGKEPCVRITMSDGSWVETALNHRVLTDLGWRFVSECFPDIEQLVSRDLLDSTLDNDRPIPVLDEGHLSQKQLSWQDHYFENFYRYDEQLLSDQEIYQVYSPSQGGVRLHDVALCNEDAQAYRYTSNHLSKLDRLSIQDDLDQIVGQFFESLCSTVCNVFQSYYEIPQAVQLFLDAEFGELQSSILNNVHRDQYISCPSPLCINNNKIISIKSVGVKELFDFEVKKYHNYCAAGLVHHNSEGIGGYETTKHLTGIYPKWWKGRRFEHAVRAWACEKTGQKVRDVAQFKLVGQPGKEGTALLPGDLITDTRKKPGNVPDALEYVKVRHVDGDDSFLVFKSYDQGRTAFEGDDIEVIWLDEECPLDIYGECVIRTMTVNGIVMLTFTPLLGLSDTVLNFMPNGQIPEKQTGTKFIINATWDDAPHLTEKDKKEIFEDTPPYLRDARAKGIPQLGSGAIYPILEEDITINDFEIPEWWARVYAFDTGWNWTAAVWGAWDRESDLVVLYSAYKQAQAEPATHAQAILARGDWIPGVYDQRAHASSEVDGTKLINEYFDLGLQLSPAERAVEAGILAVWKRLVSGRLKICKSLVEWFNEFRVYRRDEKGNIVKENDHLMDCTRGLILTGLNVAKLMPFDDYEEEHDARRTIAGATGRSKHTGY